MNTLQRLVQDWIGAVMVLLIVVFAASTVASLWLGIRAELLSGVFGGSTRCNTPSNLAIEHGVPDGEGAFARRSPQTDRTTALEPSGPRQAMTNPFEERSLFLL